MDTDHRGGGWSVVGKRTSVRCSHGCSANRLRYYAAPASPRRCISPTYALSSLNRSQIAAARPSQHSTSTTSPLARTRGTSGHDASLLLKLRPNLLCYCAHTHAWLRVSLFWCARGCLRLCVRRVCVPPLLVSALRRLARGVLALIYPEELRLFYSRARGGARRVRAPPAARGHPNPLCFLSFSAHAHPRCCWRRRPRRRHRRRRRGSARPSDSPPRARKFATRTSTPPSPRAAATIMPRATRGH